MASLILWNLNEDLILRLKRRAARHGRSGEAAIDFDACAAELRSLTAGRRHTPAEQLLREGRDGR
jgi:antitoxin FitA